MTPQIRDRMAKCKALMASPIAGEAAAAKAMFDKLTAKYGSATIAAPLTASAFREMSPETFAEILREYGKARGQWTGR